MTPARSINRVLTARAVVAVSAARSDARVYTPRVVAPHNAYSYSLKTFSQFPRWRSLTGDARAWEVYRYLADPRTGLFPLGKEVLEGRDVLSEFQTVRDPVKLIN